jgi:hypothetical protein
LLCPEAASFGTSLWSTNRQRCGSIGRTFWGGSFATFQVTTSISRFPSSSIQSRECESANPISGLFAHARDRSSHVERRRSAPCRPCITSRHAPSRPSSARCSATRSGLFCTRPCRTNVLPFPPSSFRPAALVGFTFRPFAGLLPRMGEPSPFLALGPTCRFARPRVPRPDLFSSG